MKGQLYGKMNGSIDLTTVTDGEVYTFIMPSGCSVRVEARATNYE